MKLPVYLDNHSTTKVDPRVVEAMLPYFSDDFGNAASRHHEYGWRAGAAVEIARKSVAHLIGASKEEIVFTSGATESINLALKGVAEALAHKGNHLVTAATEHKAVLDTCKRLERYGFQVTILPVDGTGLVDVDAIRNAINEKTILVSVMMANNEIGTIAPISEVGTVCREKGVFFHTDATQAVGKIRVDVNSLRVDLMSFSAHKVYGPKGIGALYFNRGNASLKIASMIDGGGHERGMRSGTLNVPAIVGFGEAARIAGSETSDENARIGRLRDRFVETILRDVEDVSVNGHPEFRLSNNANLTFRYAKADAVLARMTDVACSSGAACSSAQPEPSHVLRAIGLTDEEAACSLRFGLGRFTTEEEIDYAAKRVKEVVAGVRAKQFQLTH